jgi:hypothetical protein
MIAYERHSELDKDMPVDYFPDASNKKKDKNEIPKTLELTFAENNQEPDVHHLFKIY